jgi:hypothetical protein
MHSEGQRQRERERERGEREKERKKGVDREHQPIKLGAPV